METLNWKDIRRRRIYPVFQDFALLLKRILHPEKLASKKFGY